ncbi:P27 family phage terminase small subunit [Brevibacillus agri]|uniref:P27 family phage terminase small subunit n=1 Tax=Brevibacillus agri TaxID=51101 RepID=UPI002E1E69CE|nr:P27 family phage terminase small subunit [Brevibacillus agri]MED1657712.1 P27 family phage terminase small subunit [Brevibacillus agri]MED1689469.1 P27 family phage terminase small subunit [Brevibacillus agri]MED1694297.1 P27 family phage terminase small subunit [Brevibacillus agri]MED1698523.1 P27 family phage terminase small subunit [Brevibacillus agri]
MAKMTKAAVKRTTIRDMRSLGTYKKEYDRIIEIYAELVEQYAILYERFASGGYQYEVPTADGGAKKAPIVATLESLRKDILAYTDRLCLNPKTIDGITVETKKQSALAAALSALE